MALYPLYSNDSVLYVERNEHEALWLLYVLRYTQNTGHNMGATIYSEPKSKGSVIVECRISLMHAVHRYEDNFCENIMR